MMNANPTSGGNSTGLAAGLKGTGYKQVQNFTPEQMQLFQRLFGQVAPESGLSRLASGSPEAFEQLEAPAYQQFNEQLGNIANRFSGAGTGARRSSGFQQATSGAAQNFAQQLQAQRLGLQRQAMHDLMGMSQQLLGHESYLTPEKKPFWKELLSSGAGGIGTIAGGALGSLLGPVGTSLGSMAGGALGSAVGNYFNSQ